MCEEDGKDNAVLDAHSDLQWHAVKLRERQKELNETKQILMGFQEILKDLETATCKMLLDDRPEFQRRIAKLSKRQKELEESKKRLLVSQALLEAFKSVEEKKAGRPPRQVTDSCAGGDSPAKSDGKGNDLLERHPDLQWLVAKTRERQKELKKAEETLMVLQFFKAVFKVMNSMKEKKAGPRSGQVADGGARGDSPAKSDGVA